MRAWPFFDPVGQVACTLKSMSIPRSIPFFWRITRVQVKQPQCAPVSTIMLPRGARGSTGPPRALSTQRPPPQFKSNIEVVQIWTGLSTDLPSDPASTHSPGVPRPPSPGSSPADHCHDTHASPTTRTDRHPALTSRGIHHIECSASAPHLRSSAPPLLRHCTPRQACVRKHTHKHSQRPVPLCAFF